MVYIRVYMTICIMHEYLESFTLYLGRTEVPSFSYLDFILSLFTH